MGSGRVPTCVGLLAAVAVLAVAPAALAQPVRPARGPGLDAPASLSLPTDNLMNPMSPVPPRTALQPPRRDPGGIPYEPDFTLPDGSIIPVPQSKKLNVKYNHRYGTPFHTKLITLPDGSKRLLFTGGVIINVASVDGQEQTEFATDDAVVWIRGGQPLNIQEGFTTGDGKTEFEVYMSGNVIIRSTRGAPGKQVTQTLRAQEVYYDAERNRAIALRADLELSLPNIPDSFHLFGEEVRRLDPENWEILQGSANASKLPSDPGLRIDSPRLTLSQRRVVRTNIFGIPIRDLLTGEPVEGLEQIVTGKNVVTYLGGVPVFYVPRVRADATDPLGPLEGLSFSQNRIFGSQFYTTWDIYELLALRPPPGHKWRLNLDYLSKRGPAAGSDYVYRVPGAEPGDPNVGAGLVKLYGIADDGFDLLGGFRGPPDPMPPSFRGRAMWRHQQEILEGMYFQGQAAYLSDKNFLEQYYKNEFDMGPNQETFAHLAWQRENYGAAGLVKGRVGREWVGETNALPRIDGHLVGQTFFDDWLVYSTRANAGYYQVRPSEVNPFPLLPTDRRIDTGRFDLWQELSVPMALGPVKLAPYAVLDLTHYTEDLTGEARSRIWGGGGARASVPFSRLYPDVCSELLNLRGLYHKVVLGANYRYVGSDTPFTRLPLIDRLNDDAVDFAWRNITPLQPLFLPGPDGVRLATSPVFNPQLYAIRRGVENRIDTLDDLQVVQMDARQRFQTKRGYPGLEHTVDFLTLDLSASYFPEARRDNFGHPFAFLEYGAVWNVGDRTSLVSSGWFEPYQDGSRYYNAGVYMNRPDRTSFYAGYRQTDPLHSKAVVLTMGYQLSQRYYVNIGASYDFGIQQALSNSFTLTRTGADLTVTLGFTYNAFVNSFGFQFLVVPNLLASAGGRFAGAPIGAQTLGGRR